MSSKQLTTFSDFRSPDGGSDFLSARRYTEYLNEYCSHFALWPYIHLSTKVQSVNRSGSGNKHIIQCLSKTEGINTWECDAIAVCSGLHVVPSIPLIPGIERVPAVLHSSEFKTREQFGRDTTVLVLGTGETGADISYLAVTSPTKRVVLCHRDGFHFAPKVHTPSPLTRLLATTTPRTPWLIHMIFSVSFSEKREILILSYFQSWATRPMGNSPFPLTAAGLAFSTRRTCTRSCETTRSSGSSITRTSSRFSGSLLALRPV